MILPLIWRIDPRIGTVIGGGNVNTPHLSGGVRPCVGDLTDTGTDRLVSVLAALGHRLRLQLWWMLAPYGPCGVSAGFIATQLAVAPSSLSFHLQQMTQAVFSPAALEVVGSFMR